MIEPKVSVDPKVMRRFNQVVNEMIELSGEPAEKIIRQQARLTAVDAAWWTDRPGFDKSVLEKHKESIQRKVEYIYRSVDTLYEFIENKYGYGAKWEFEQAANAKNTAKCRELYKRFTGKDRAFVKWDKGALHRKWKKNPNSRFWAYMVGPTKSRSAYIRRQQSNIGNAKAGWARAAEKIGGVKSPTKGIPAWAKKKKHKTKGLGTFIANGAKSVAKITNLSKYGISRETINQALRQRVFQTKDVMKRMMERNAKQATRDFNKGRRFVKKFL